MCPARLPPVTVEHRRAAEAWARTRITDNINQNTPKCLLFKNLKRFGVPGLANFKGGRGMAGLVLYYRKATAEFSQIPLPLGR